MPALFKHISMAMRIPRVHHMLKILNYDIQRSDLLKHASAMAYVTLFSLVPSLAAVFSLVSLFKPFLGKDSNLLLKAKTFILQNLATGTGEQVINYIDSFLGNLDMKKIGITGFAGLLFTLILLLRQIEIALNRIWLVQKPRHIVTRFVYFWTILTLGTLIIGLGIGIFSGFDVHKLNPFQKVDLSFGASIVATLTPFATTLLSFLLLYKFVPNCHVKWRYAVLGALPAALMFSVAGSSYAFFAARFTNYKAIYGALAAIPLFLIWLYILWVITLLGALLAWRFEQSFDEDNYLDKTPENLSAADRLRNQQVQGILPIVCLLLIHDQFENGNGSGISGQSIAHQLNLPPHWLIESLESLIQLQLAISKTPEGDLEAGPDLLHAIFFPAHSSHKLKFNQAWEKIHESARHWVHSWKHDWPFEIKNLMIKLLDSRTLKSDPSFAELLTASPSERS